MKRIVIALLAALFALALIGCTSTPAPIEPAEPPQQSTPAPPPVDELAPQAEEVESQIPSGAIDWTEAGQHVGQVVTVYGTVAGARFIESGNGQPTFINIGVDHPNQNRVTAVIWGGNRGNFPQAPEAMYRGRTITVTGEVYIFDGAANIEVTSPAQIQIVE